MELEEYVCIWEDYFSDQMVEAELKTNAAQEAYDDDKRQWEVKNSKLQQCTKIGDQYRLNFKMTEEDMAAYHH